MAPGFDIAKACPFAIWAEGDHRFAFAHFFLDIFGASFGDTGAAGLCRRGHFIADDLREAQVSVVGYQYFKLLCLHVTRSECEDYNGCATVRIHVCPDGGS